MQVNVSTSGNNYVVSWDSVSSFGDNVYYTVEQSTDNTNWIYIKDDYDMFKKDQVAIPALASGTYYYRVKAKETETLRLKTFGHANGLASFPSEKWVSVTAGGDNTGKIVWAQGHTREQIIELNDNSIICSLVCP